MDINQAREQIERILCELEKDTGSLVDSISLELVDATTYSSKRQQQVARVDISMQRTPGRSWPDWDRKPPPTTEYVR